ncbi:hypothetical protein U9M48_027774 [Paspalum notatum var. saurae]|uniref:Uncharacterized protein n=1 Tax=Paspalum notatum var. saurae TaxID=547442 RepID=A0AAQ3TVH7_PASNO
MDPLPTPATKTHSSGEADYDHKVIKYDLEKAKWEKSNKKCLLIPKRSVVDAVKGSILECETAREYLGKLAAQFVGSSKAYASTLTKQFANMRYDRSGMRAYIQKMTSMVAKLNKYFEAPLPVEYVVHTIMQSLPKEYETLHMNYNNTVKDKWTLEQLMDQCVQEEERRDLSPAGLIQSTLQI